MRDVDTETLKKELTQVTKRAQELRALLRHQKKGPSRGRAPNSLPALVLHILRERGPMKAGDLLAAVVPVHGVKTTSARTLIASMCGTKEILRTGSRGSYMYSAA